MGITSIGPSGLDPFTPTPAPAEERPEVRQDQETQEKPTLPEGVGTTVDTSA